MFNKNTPAKAKIALNKKLGLCRVLAAFTAENDGKKLTQLNAQFISSDFRWSEEEVAFQLEQAKRALGTTELVVL